MKEYPVSYITNEIKLCTKLSELWIVKLLSMANNLMQFENSMLMYGIYNVETLEKLINSVHNMHNTTSLHERLFAGQQSSLTLRLLYANSLGLHHYSINALLYLRMVQDKYNVVYDQKI